MRQVAVDTEDFLRRVPLFVDLPDAAIHLLASLVRLRAFPAGEVIFHQDDPGNGLYVVRRGMVKIALTAPDGQETLVALMHEGACFGELAVLDGHPRSASAIALDPTETYFLSRRDFLAFLSEHPSVTMQVIVLLARRLRDTDGLLADLVFFDVYGRLAKKILDLADTYGVPTAEGVRIDLTLTQQELASLVGSSRESVNKVMRHFRDRGYLSVSQHRIHILNRTALEHRASY